MSTAARCWRAERRLRRGNLRSRFAWKRDALCSFWLCGAAVVALTGVPTLGTVTAQTANPTVAANQAAARKILDRTIQAMGGPVWLNVHAVRTTGTTAGFFQGEPTGAVAQTTNIVEYSSDFKPARERVDLAKGRVVHIYVGHKGWEITYKGAKRLATEKLTHALRWRDHSLRVALCVWYREPGTMVAYGGQAIDGNRLMDNVTLFSPHDDSITLEVDALTHLPRRLSFAWRDPAFHDINHDAVEYDNYRRINGIETPFTVTWTHNGETAYQRFLQDVHYNPQLSHNLFNPQDAAAHLK